MREWLQDEGTAKEEDDSVLTAMICKKIKKNARKRTENNGYNETKKKQGYNSEIVTLTLAISASGPSAALPSAPH